jgi:hypothetical protein
MPIPCAGDPAVTSVGEPTPHPDVNAVLRQLVAGAQAILGPRFVGLYLDGSLAAGDFDAAKSDIDFVVVTDDDVPHELYLALKALHARLAGGDSKWATELEGSYVPRRALRRDWDPVRHPNIERGDGNLALVRPERGYWVLHRWILREHGVRVVGEPLAGLIDLVSSDDLREAVRDVLREWWVPMLADPTRLRNMFYRCYAVLTMCRILYTLHHGTLVSKPVAGRWAQEMLDERWSPLIRHALAWSREAPPDTNETLDFIRYTSQRA